MANHGGGRPGAGRKPGQVNKVSKAAIEEAKATGELPHEFLLRVARGEAIEHHGSHIKLDIETRIACAEAVAPYYAPRLASVEQKIESTVNHVISGEPLDEEAIRNSTGGARPVARKYGVSRAYVRLLRKNANSNGLGTTA